MRDPVVRRVLMVLAAVIALGVATRPATADDRAGERLLRRTPVVEVFEATRDAVVSISSTDIVRVESRSPFDSLFDDYFDLPHRSRKRRVASVGSGFVIHPDGYIVTNAHVIARTAEQTVTFADGKAYRAQIVASDIDRDIAVLKIEADSAVPTIKLGRSDDLMVGETVIAIGNPLGFQHTVTTGVVSAVHREIEVSADLTFRDLIQTDASINPGNSGGPLLNALGELIGVNCAIRGDAQNIGFAISVDRLREVLPELLDVERRYRIVSGMRVDNLAAEPLVSRVDRDSPAERAGIRRGDLLEAIEGRAVREGIDFDIALINRRPNDALELTLRRDGQPFDARLHLAPRAAPDGERLALDRLGIEVYPLPQHVAADLGLGGARGLMISQVEPGGPADEAGILPRDILLSLGRYYVSTVGELGQLLEPLGSGETVTVRILRVEVRRRRKVQRSGPIRIR